MSLAAHPPGWGDNDPDAVLSAYTRSRPAGWPEPDGRDAVTFFASEFRATQPDDGLLTGYFEPELDASPEQSEDFTVPLYAPPDGGLPQGTWHSRAEIEEGNLLAGCEIAWLRSPLDAFIAQVQGSVRLRLPDATVMRLGYAGRNGHPYRSIGQELVAAGTIAPGSLSLAAIRTWCAANPAEVGPLLRRNPSYVFFRVLDTDLSLGPVGTAGVALTPRCSIAVDPDFVPLGAPVWIEAEGPGPLRLLAIAQDTGSAIRGRGRADLFCGTGPASEAVAGALNRPCRITALTPGGKG